MAEVAKTRVVRPKTRPAKVTQPTSPWDHSLSPGDHVEFGITAEVKNRQGRSYWVKGGAVVTMREGESVGQCTSRVQTFVIDMVEEQITEYVRP